MKTASVQTTTGVTPSFDPIGTTRALDANNTIKTTTCYMCACRCGIKVHLREGPSGPEVRYIEGNPEHPLNQGVICAKGGAGAMKQYSPARLTTPLRRKVGAKRGEAQFEPISWEETFSILETRLAQLRATDPKKFALFTGRDQMQALTGLFARQFGTPNYAAHGGFCSVNMAAGMIYTIGGSFWEFGGPDLDKAKLFVMFGTAEDHHSNPLKIALSKFKRSGGRFISINPIRTGYSAIADEWIPIKPGTDGALLMAINHVLLRDNLADMDFVREYTNAAQLVNNDPASDSYGMFELHQNTPTRASIYDKANQSVWCARTQRPVEWMQRFEHNAELALDGEYTMPDGTPVTPAFALLQSRFASTTPQWAADITGISAARIEQLAKEIGHTARDQAFTLPIEWTDSWGRKHATVQGRPVAFHAMRGLAAHSNGFQTVRALAVMMSLIGTIDRPGGFRHKAPFPKAIPPNVKPPAKWSDIKPNTPLGGAPLGFPATPDELAVGDDGGALRIDKGFTWEHPLSAHGLMHNVITNAWRGDPYPIDTLMIFMANMAWNSSMNTHQVRDMLNDTHANGEYKIPFIVVCDAFQSEMTAYADLILPDTTYLERHDVMGLLDRPISEFDGPMDSVRVPVLPVTGDCKPFQEVLVELASRLKFPLFTTPAGARKFKGYEDFIINYEHAPGIGFLAGWRGADGSKSIKGEPNPNQWQMYADNNCVYHHETPASMQYMRNWNKEYLAFSKDNSFRRLDEPITIHLYSDLLQGFRLAAQGKRVGKQPPEHLRKRVEAYFDPLPFWYEPLEDSATDKTAYPLNAVTQRPMAMYHSWDSQNAWLRQIHSHNYLFVHPSTAQTAGVQDGGWMWVESQWGKVRCMARFSEAVEPGTVWTWNAIGKAKGAWNLSENADESQKGFLLNHLISEELPLSGAASAHHPTGRTVSNSDPITGQAGWYDVRVRIRPASPDEPKETWPQYEAMKPYAGSTVARALSGVVQFFAGTGKHALKGPLA
jgi:sulfite dehydrogenase (quinone) subunit SoeA